MQMNYLYKNIGVKSIFLWIIGFLSIGFLYPTAYTSVWFGNYVAYACLAFCIVYILFNVNKIPHLDYSFLVIVILWWAYYLLRVYMYNEPRSSEVSNSLVYSMVFLVYSLTALGHRKTGSLFVWTHFVMLVLSLIGIGILMVGIQLPVLSTFQINDHQMLNNYGLFFQKTWDIKGLDFYHFLRPNGYYDEPGTFAFMIFLVLMYNKLFIRDKKIEMFFLLAGFITMSLAHFITAIGYYFLFIFNKKNTRYAVIAFVLVVLFYFLKPSDDSSYLADVWKMVYGRLEGFINGEDTSRDFNASYEAFKYFFLVGASQDEIIHHFPDAEVSTIWFFLAHNGLIGSIIYSLIFVVPCSSFVSKKNSDGLKLLLLLAVNFLQRPYLHFPIIMLAVYLILFPNYNNSKQCLIKRVI